MSKHPLFCPHPADYRSTHYTRTGGRGLDHFLRLRRDRTYFWATLDDDERLRQATGSWQFDEVERSLRFDPAPEPYWPLLRIEFVRGMESASLMFLATQRSPRLLATPNLPLLFYLVGRPGEVETCPWWAHADRPLDV